jgi:hypothetical protein
MSSYYEPDNQDHYYDNRPRREPGPPPHSGLGIASFIIAMVVVVVGLVAVLLIVLASGRPYRRDAEPLIAMLVGLICLGFVAALVGIGLGIGGCVQEDRNRTFAVTGLIINGIIVLGVAMLFLIGLAVDARWMR